MTHGFLWKMILVQNQPKIMVPMFSSQASPNRNTHIDGIGRPGMSAITKNIHDFQGPLSVALQLTNHCGTAIGGNILDTIAQDIYDMPIDDEAKMEDIANRLNHLFQQEEPILKASSKEVKAGTCNISPKNLTIHRGVASGKKTSRLVLYWTMCRSSLKESYALDEAETAEFLQLSQVVGLLYPASSCGLSACIHFGLFVCVCLSCYSLRMSCFFLGHHFDFSTRTHFELFL